MVEMGAARMEGIGRGGQPTLATNQDRALATPREKSRPETGAAKEEEWRRSEQGANMST